MISLSKIHPFPARMAPSIVADILESAEKNQIVLDPMAGSGTTLAIAAHLGHRAIGFDTDPMAVLLSETITKNFDVDEIIKKSENLIKQAKKIFSALKLASAYPLNADDETKKFVRYWFCHTSRKQLHCLAKKISNLKDKDQKKLFWVAFSKLIIKKDNGASLARDVSHSRPHKTYERAPIKPFDLFTSYVIQTYNNILKLGISKPESIKVKKGDARYLNLGKNSVDLVITSPPYFNAIDYIRGHKLSLVWMGYNLKDLRNIRSTNVGAEIGYIPKKENKELEAVIKKFGKINKLPSRQRNMLANYANDMQKIVYEISRVLKSKGKAFFVIGDCNLKGIFIKNSEVIKYLFAQLGFSVICKYKRKIPDNRRYLPPPKSCGNLMMNSRMREEIVLGVQKP